MAEPPPAWASGRADMALRKLAAVIRQGLCCLTAIMAGFAARGLASATSVRSYETPVELPPLPISAGWHARYDADPENRWLRAQVQDIASELAGTAPSSARVQSR
jgi:DNA-binding transcriptional LysR family regulator